ncbi:Flavodoxin reductases (ferredoxin-NADPH reductases) family 1 [Methanosarcina siciliae C2J]|uniref:Flavodoxin reductases (Ferredoxin-NADPH reductases) family 1 n=2 Tax=Methanosarcina siciliae TaxID=38027 RepID=A0A0E3PE41_9EURY|nr:FAD-dependent oxidoreductase [Methanosarcina siciliae]AKB32868.1 Flavodoxin reductases (ferredoxin-NADPH reductases) family 1 [Methanosarcina siciliae HI350]AKB37187.1 Flavodoxin reductases (ferredoxin-NADPH reductases) family 1 [Methanosarcina siciliae C2J]
MFFETRVIEVIQRTPDVKSVRFEKPQEFSYLAGQYVVLILGGSSDPMKKPFTLSSSPTEEFLEITKKLTGHPFSNALATLKPGDRVSINGPYGDFTFLEEYKNIGMLSGGIGITPLRSIIKYLVDKKLNTSITLLYSNRSENDIAFKEELENAQKQNPDIKIIDTITRPGSDWKGVTGRINAEMIKKYIPDYRERTFFTCGPSRMVDSMVSLLKELEIPEKQIKREIFPGEN